MLYYFLGIAFGIRAQNKNNSYDEAAKHKRPGDGRFRT